METKPKLAVITALLFFVFLAVGISAQDPSPFESIPHTVGVSGKATDTGLVLSVRFDPGNRDASPFDAFRLYSMPSGTLLFAHYDPFRDLEQKPGLSTHLGTMTAFQHQVTLPTDLLVSRDTKISIRLLHEGKEHVVSRGSIDLTDFQVTSRFAVTTVLGQPLRSDAVLSFGCSPGEFEHCAAGPRCTRGCICCDSVEFCSNLVTCNLECGDHDDC